MSSVKEGVKAILAERLGWNESDIEMNSTLSYLGANAEAEVDIIMAIEKASGIIIPDDDAEKMKTVNDIVSYLGKHGVTHLELGLVSFGGSVFEGEKKESALEHGVKHGAQHMLLHFLHNL